MDRMEKETANKRNINALKPITADDHDQHQIDDHDDQRMMNANHADEQVQIQNQDKLLPFVCPICNQRFKSGQALGGHRRIHGNDSMNNKRKGTDFDHQDHDQLDLEKSPKQDGNRPYVTTKRGSGQGSGCSSSLAASNFVDDSGVDDGIDTEMEEAAITLMLLAHHNHHVSLSSSTLHDQINTKEEGEEEEKNLTRMTSTRERSEDDQYVCRDGKISFPTYQALGGHTSTHNEKNINNNLTSFIDSSRSGGEKVTTHDTDGDDGDRDDVSNQKGGGRKIVFDFDLNELPPPEA